MKLLRSVLAWMALACLLAGAPGHAATLLPNGEQYFTDQNGLPLAGGKVFFYVPNTTTPKDTYGDSGQTVLNSNPVILDGSGRAVIYGAGSYRQVVEDSNNSIIWDQLTADTSASGSSYGGVSGGSANAQTALAGSFTSQAGQSIQFVAGFTNTSSLSLTPAGGSPIAVLKDTTTGPIALSGGEVVTGNSYIVVYDGALGAFHLVAYPATGPLVTIASAATANIGAAASHNIAISGTATTTSFGSSAVLAAPVFTILYTGAGPWQITESASLLTPGGGNLVINTNDYLTLIYLGSGNWQVLAVNRAPGNHTVLARVLFITTTATYTPSSGFAFADITCVGGGGGGGGTTTGGAGTATAGGGGGGGEIAGGLFLPSQIGASQTATIGAAGAGGSTLSGTGGGTTSLGTLLTCIGGAGGSAGNGVPGLGGTGGTGGTIRTPGAPGGYGIAVSSAALAFGGAGGAGLNGGGGATSISAQGGGAATAGANGLANGAGGGGSATVTSGASEAGGNGVKGAVIIKEWIFAP